jgi:hypothetical protein
LVGNPELEEPPAIRTLPLGRSVAVWDFLASFKEGPEVLHVAANEQTERRNSKIQETINAFFNIKTPLYSAPRPKRMPDKVIILNRQILSRDI